MTSTVKISAHCPANKEVKVTVSEGGRVIEELTLQDGETTDRYIYEDRSVLAREVLKAVEVLPMAGFGLNG